LWTRWSSRLEGQGNVLVGEEVDGVDGVDGVDEVDEVGQR